MGIGPEEITNITGMKNLDLINKSELSRLLGTEIRKDRIPAKHKDKLQELSDLIEYWKKRNRLN